MKKLFIAFSLSFFLVIVSGAFANVQAQHSREVYKTKKPWSHKKKDAVIGAGAGAVTGAIVGHGAKGAVIGGVVGGGAGYLVGRHQDKRHPVPARKRVYKRRSY